LLDETVASHKRHLIQEGDYYTWVVQAAQNLDSFL